MLTPSEINWSDPNAKISKYFTVHEALYLPTWSRMAKESELSEEIKKNILDTAATMDIIRAFLSVPIIVHCWLRPPAYNRIVGGATGSAHLSGRGVDFHAKGLSCDKVRELLAPKLEELKIRMEKLPGSSWVHIDTASPGPTGNRYFNPRSKYERQRTD